MPPNLTDLPELSRILLEVVAASVVSLTRTQAVAAIRKIHRKTPDGKAWHTTRIAGAVADLEKRGALRRGGRLEALPAARDATLSELRASGRLLPLVAAIGAAAKPEDHELHLQLAVLAGDVEKARGSWHRERAAGYSATPLCDVWMAPPALDAIVQWPDPILDLLLQEVWDIERFDRDPEACALLRPLFQELVAGGRASPTLVARWAEECVWCGALAEAEALVDGLDHPRAGVLQGWVHLLTGNAAAAAKALDTAFPKRRLGTFGRAPPARAGATPERSVEGGPNGPTGKKKKQGTGSSGPARDRPEPSRALLGERTDRLFHVLALLALGTKGAGKKARTRAARGLGKEGDLNADPLPALVLASAGLKSKDASQYRFSSRDPDIAQVAEGLVAVWLGGPWPCDLEEDLTALAAAADPLGHTWLAEEARDLLARKRGERGVRTTAAVPLADLIAPTPAWIAKLQAFDTAARVEAALPGSTPEVGNERLVWSLSRRLYGGVPEMSPRLQKRNKKGWTKGRAVALSRLYRSPGELGYLSAADRRVTDTITHEVTYGGYRGRYRNEVYDLPPTRGMRALVGHPHVCWEDAPLDRVEVAAGRPALRITPAAGGVTVRLDPATDAEVVVRVIGDHRVEVVELSEVHQRMAAALDGELVVPTSALEQLRVVVERASAHVTVASDVAGWGAAAVEVDGTVRLRARLDERGVRVRAVVTPLGPGGTELPAGTGAPTVGGTRDGASVQGTRDLAAEQAGVDALADACPTLRDWPGDGGAWRVDGPAALALVGELAALGEQVGWKGRQPVVTTASAADLTLSVATDEALRVEGTLTLPDPVSLGAVVDLLAHSPGRVLALGDDRFLVLTEALRGLLAAVGRTSRRVGDALEVHPLAAEAVGALAEASGSAEVDAACASLVERIREAGALVAPVPTTLRAELRSYQEDGFRWLARLAHWGAGACLADDMGLGKTVQALALLLRRAADGPALVVAPKSVCAGWVAEARRFAPTLTVHDLGRTSRRAAVVAGAGAGDVVVCSYGVLAANAAMLADVAWSTAVLDEAQHIKNPRTKRAKAAFGLSARFRMVCTGTPIENRLTELWSLFRFLAPGLLGTEKHFQTTWRTPIEGSGDRDARASLRRLVRPFVLRRTKAAVLDELPPRTDITVRVALSRGEAALYEALRAEALADLAEHGDDASWRMRIFAHLTRLRLAVCHPRLIDGDHAVATSAKGAAVSELIDELRAGGHRALVFSQFVRHLARIRADLDARGVPYQYLDGQTSARAREAAVAAFQAGEGDLFLISLRAGGTGLNLTAADYVLHLDPWWNPAVEDQASDRAHRIGQTRPVTVYRLVAADTIEEAIVDLHARKRALAESILEGAEAATVLTVEEVRVLLEG